MRVATYSRCSTDHHKQNPDLQVQELRRFCAGRDWVISRELVDHGFSGGNDQRPGLKEIMRLVQSREVDVVVVTRLDRLFRSLRHLCATLELFEANGVKFVASDGSIDWTTPTGRLLTQVLGALAEFQRALLRERTMMGLAYARSKGKKLGRPRVHDESAIIELRAQGLTYKQIEGRLGVPSGCISRALRRARKTSSDPPGFDSGKTGT
jgi:DNA invertase Pin-like site-specific DNA recombinase